VTDTLLSLQSPIDEHSQHLLEVLLEQSIDARVGGAAYAWATEYGIRLLLRDPIFEEFLATSDFQLVIGVDEITTPSALRVLAELEAKYPGLDVRAFMSQDRQGLFHPKLAWFSHPGFGSLVVGSGNLTWGGLWNNWEAFTLSTVDMAAMQELQEQWRLWRTVNAANLFAVLDARVLEKAEQNRRWTSRRRAPAPVGIPAAVLAATGLCLLIAEIPASGDRWSQANFDRQNYEEFFGAAVGTQRRMLFQHLRVDGALGQIESRPSVEVVSHNWRFELDAAKGLAYPQSGRPIGVFLRLRARTFLYLLSMPGDDHHDELVQYLDASPLASDTIRRIRVDGPQLPELHSVQMLLAAGETAFVDVVPD
jgi:hypothetical protein